MIQLLHIFVHRKPLFTSVTQLKQLVIWCYRVVGYNVLRADSACLLTPIGKNYSSEANVGGASNWKSRKVPVEYNALVPFHFVHWHHAFAHISVPYLTWVHLRNKGSISHYLTMPCFLRTKILISTSILYTIDWFMQLDLSLWRHVNFLLNLSPNVTILTASKTYRI